MYTSLSPVGAQTRELIASAVLTVDFSLKKSAESRDTPVTEEGVTSTAACKGTGVGVLGAGVSVGSSGGRV
jgi:hypothetical protein